MVMIREGLRFFTFTLAPISHANSHFGLGHGHIYLVHGTEGASRAAESCALWWTGPRFAASDAGF